MASPSQRPLTVGEDGDELGMGGEQGVDAD